MSDDLSIPNPGYRGSNRANRYSRAAQPRRPGMDPDTRRLVLFAGGVGSVLALLIAASAITSRHAGQVPVISASSDPIRVKPENPGGLHVMTGDSDIFSGGSDTKNVRLAPVAEKPDPQALQEDDAPQPAAAPAGAAPTVAASGAAVEAAPAKQAAAAAVPVAKAAAPAARPQPDSRAAAAPAKAQPESHPESHPSGHTVMVQLAAMTTEAGAKEEWQRLTKRYADVFEGRSLSVSKTERDGHSFWRVRTGGFGDVAQARAFCDKLRGKSSGCSIVEF